MKNNIWSMFKRDESRNTNGAVLILTRNDDGTPAISVTVMRIHNANQAFADTAALLKRERQYQLDKANAEDSQKLMADITKESVIRTCVKSWTGFTEDDGVTEMPCTVDNVRRIEKLLPELFDSIVEFGADPQNYVGEFNEAETIKN